LTVKAGNFTWIQKALEPFVNCRTSRWPLIEIHLLQTLG